MLDSPYRAPVQDSHLRSQRPCPAHLASLGPDGPPLTTGPLRLGGNEGPLTRPHQSAPQKENRCIRAFGISPFPPVARPNDRRVSGDFRALRAPRRARTTSATATARVRWRDSTARTGSRSRRRRGRGVFELPAGAHSRTRIQESSPSFTRRSTVTSTPRPRPPARIASPGGAATRAVMNGRRRSRTGRSGEAAVPRAG